jgi:exosome complex component RRP40
MNEPVVGLILSSPGEFYKVDIGGPHIATMSRNAFEGVTKKNRPNLLTGSLVYCRVSLANKDMEPELECMATSGKGEGFGELKDGYQFTTSLGLARSYV